VFDHAFVGRCWPGEEDAEKVGRQLRVVIGHAETSLFKQYTMNLDADVKDEHICSQVQCVQLFKAAEPAVVAELARHVQEKMSSKTPRPIQGQGVGSKLVSEESYLERFVSWLYLSVSN
jgi:hypothetical protein